MQPGLLFLALCFHGGMIIYMGLCLLNTPKSNFGLSTAKGSINMDGNCNIQ